MNIDRIQLTNFKSVEDQSIELGNVTVLIGENNSGKSTIIQALSLLQPTGSVIEAELIRVGAAELTIALEIGQISTADGPRFIIPEGHRNRTAKLVRQIPAKSTWISYNDSGGSQPFKGFTPEIKSHYIIPMLAKRKGSHLEETVSTGNRVLPGGLHQLLPRVQQFSAPSYPHHEAYRQACQAAFGVGIDVVSSANGSKPGLYVGDREVPIDQMGDGVLQFVGFATGIIGASGKLFLIEEPENDLHPRALREVLKLIHKASDQNQFVVSTHSAIVLQELASIAGAKTYCVTKEDLGGPPVTRFSLVETKEERTQVLLDLGFLPGDFGLWEAWLFLEESSAQSILQQIIIPWFIPQLNGRLQIYSCGGVDKVKAAIDRFGTVMVFMTQESIYKNRTWVIVDGDQAGLDVVEGLRKSFEKSLSAERIRHWSQPHLEEYYPEQFQERVAGLSAIKDRQLRRTAKSVLLKDVLDWSRTAVDAKEAWESCASELIERMREIAAALDGAVAEADK